MRIRLAAGVIVLAVAPVATGCSINIGDCIDFGVAGAKVVAYQASVTSGEMSEAEVAEAQAEIAQAREDVPDEVQDEFGVVADAFDEFFVRIEAANADDEVTEEEWTQAAEPFEDPAVTTATDSMSAWLEENCVPG